MNMKPVTCITLVALAILLVSAQGCGPKPKRAESILDTPEYHYREGKRLVGEGDYDGAMVEFQRAKALDPDYAPAYEGIRLVYLAKGQLSMAEKSMKEAKDKDRKFSPAWVGLGRVYTAWGKYDKAIDEFKGALKVDKGNVDAYFYMGQAYVKMGKLDEAERSFKSGLDIDPTRTDVDEAWNEVNRLRRASAGMPPEYAMIAKKAAITRGELAALFATELPLDRIFREAPSCKGFEAPKGFTEEKAEAPVIDIEDHWARHYIEKCIEVGIMETYPDGTFRPNERVDRAAFAMLVQKILARALNDPGLTTRFIGSPSPFPDVPGSHFAFNAISVVTTRGIMKAKMDGTFGPLDPVSGTDALLSIRTLKDQLRM